LDGFELAVWRAQVLDQRLVAELVQADARARDVFLDGCVIVARDPKLFRRQDLGEACVYRAQLLRVGGGLRSLPSKRIQVYYATRLFSYSLVCYLCGLDSLNFDSRDFIN
jgi:hypothetical protein